MSGPNCRGVRCGGCGERVHIGECDPGAVARVQALADELMRVRDLTDRRGVLCGRCEMVARTGTDGDDDPGCTCGARIGG